MALVLFLCILFTAAAKAESNSQFVLLYNGDSSQGYEQISAKMSNQNNQTAFQSDQAMQLVVVVDINNPVNSLTKKEIIDIYMGRYKTFPDSRYAQAIDYPAGNKIKQRFYLQLVDRSERKINAYWSRLLFSGRATPPKSTNSPEEVVSELTNNPNGLAYMPEHAVTPEMKIVYRL